MPDYSLAFAIYPGDFLGFFAENAANSHISEIISIYTPCKNEKCFASPHVYSEIILDKQIYF